MLEGENISLLTNDSGYVTSSHTHTSTTISGLTVTNFATNTISQWYNDIGYVTSSHTHTTSSIISGVFDIAFGGTGTSTAPTIGQLLMGNAGGGYDLVPTSSLAVGSSTYSAIAGTSTYSNTAGTSTYANIAGTSTYATTAGSVSSSLLSGNGIVSFTYNGASIATVTVAFAGSGISNFVSRSDHDHYGVYASSTHTHTTSSISGIFGPASGGTGADSSGWTAGFAYVDSGIWTSTTSIPAGSLPGNVMLEGENISLLTNDSGYVTSSHTHTSTTISGLTVTNFATNTISQWYNDIGYVTSSHTHTTSSIISGVFDIAFGGTGTSTAPTIGQLLMGNAGGGYDLVPTSSLGFVDTDTTSSPAGNNGEIQFNNGGVFGATNTFFWNNTIGSLSVGDNYAFSLGPWSFIQGTYSQATGTNSVAMGQFAQATNDLAVAIGGSSPTASGYSSIAMGSGAQASGSNSIALGNNAKAQALYSTAIGYQTLASGNNSVAIGNSARALYQTSVAIGQNVTSSGQSAFVAGESNNSNGSYSAVFGYGNISQGSYTIMAGSNNIASSSISSDYSAVFGGYNTSSGQYTLISGRNNDVSGSYSAVIGYGNTVTPNGSFVAGQESSATGAGNGTIALGYHAVAMGNGAVAFGWSNTSSNDGAFSAGYNNIASGYYASALGSYNTSSNNSSFAAGGYNNVPATYGFALGYFNNLTSSGANGGSGALGRNNTLNGSINGSVAIGNSNSIGAGGDYGAIAMGSSSYSNGNAAMAIGTYTSSTGISSFALGYGLTVSGGYSFGVNVSTTNNPIISQANTIALMGGNVGIGDVSPLALLTVGSGDLFRVDSSGNLIRINNVAYSWPGSQGAANTILQNNGSGSLAWVSTSTLGFASSSGSNEYIQNQNVVDQNAGFRVSGVGTMSTTTIGTATPEFKLTMAGDGGIIARGTYGSGSSLTTAGAGTRLIWYPQKAAFRAGYINGTQWNNANIGNYSAAFGYNNTAIGDISFAAGGSNSVNGNSAIVLGESNTVNGAAAFAAGAYSQAITNFSVALGYQNVAQGAGSAQAYGNYAIADAQRAIAFGNYVTSSNYASMALGHKMTVSGGYSFGINVSDTPATLSQVSTIALMGGNVGISTTTPLFKLTVDGGIYASGTYGAGETLSYAGAGSRMFWYPRKAAFRAGYVDGAQWNDANIGDWSFATGYNNTVNGNLATAFGYNNNVSGGYATAFGAVNTSSADYSTSFGWGNIASGAVSTVFGRNNTASGAISTALGYNMNVSGDYSFGVNVSSTAAALAQPNTIALMGGNVGIGTTSPIGRLTVNAPNNNDGIGLYQGATATVAIGHFNYSGGIQLFSNSTTPSVQLVAAGDSYISALVGSRFGVGTTTPTSRLAVSGGVNFADGDFRFNNNAGSAGEIIMSGGSFVTPSWVSTSSLGLVDGTGSAGHVSFWSGTNSQAYDADGNFYWDGMDNRLGIGTTTPLARLHVRTNIDNDGIFISNNLNKVASKLIQASDPDGYRSGILSLLQNDVEKVSLVAKGISYLNGGNLGIGTTVPSTTLHVLGTSTLWNVIPDGPYTGNMSANNIGASTTRWNSIWVGTTNIGTGTWSLTTTGTGRLGIFTQANGGGTETMTFRSNGFIGIGTTTPEFKLSVENDGGIIAKGTYSSGATLTTSGAGTRLIWYPRKAAFRVGSVGLAGNSDAWDDSNVGIGSFVAGIDSEASGVASVAFGYNNFSTGPASFVAGANSTSSASTSFAFGNGVEASGNQAFAIGGNTIASGSRSFAGGMAGTIASGENSFAFGNNVVVSATNSVGFGMNTRVSGEGAFAFGVQTTTAAGLASFAGGVRAYAGGDFSMAFGADATTTATGDYSFALGSNIQVSGLNSFGINLSGGAAHTVSASNVFAIMGGNVGIGSTTPSYLLSMEASGGGYYNQSTNQWVDGSTLAIKQDISIITQNQREEMLGVLDDLDINRYRFIDDYTENGDDAIWQYGFIADYTDELLAGRNHDGLQTGSAVQFLLTNLQTVYRSFNPIDLAIDVGTSSLIYNVSRFSFSTSTIFENSLTDESGAKAFVLNAVNFNTSSADRYLLSLRSNDTPAFSVSANGDVHALGNMYAASAVLGTSTNPGDLAERVDIAIEENVEAGDVLMVDQNNPDSYRKTAQAYEPTVAGVVSTNPTIVVGNGKSEQTAPMAMVGRVPVKISTVNGEISRGDLLVASDVAGTAMKYDPTKDDSRKIVGIIGIALENSQNAENGKIIALIRTGWVYNKTEAAAKLEQQVQTIAAIEGINLDQEPSDIGVSNNSGGELTYTGGNLNLNNYSILNVRSIVGAGNKWMIDENGLLIAKIMTSQGEKSVYGVSSESAELQLSGSAELVNGEATVVFAADTQEIIDDSATIKVIPALTSGECNGIFVSEKSAQGFTVKELNGGTSAATFDWIVIAKRKIIISAEPPVIEESSDQGGTSGGTNPPAEEEITGDSPDEQSPPDQQSDESAPDETSFEEEPSTDESAPETPVEISPDETPPVESPPVETSSEESL